MPVAESNNKPVRVLINGLHVKSGGGVTYLSSLIPHLADDPRLELHLFIHTSQYGLFGDVDERVRLHVLELAPSFWRQLVWEQLSLPLLAKVMGADVVFSPANFGPLILSNTVIVLQNALAVFNFEWRLRRRFYWAGLTLITLAALLRCRRAIAVSDYARRALTFRLPQRTSRKVAVVRHGVQRKFSPGESKTNAGKSPRYLLAVADIYVQKNLHTLIKAYARIRETVPDIELYIAGRRIDEGYFRRLESVVAEHGLQDHVVFLGELDANALISVYRSCTVFVFPSTVETFGNPLAEAMACGAPIVASGTAAMPEVVGDAAVFFDPLDVGDMVSSILRVLQEPKLAADLRSRGLARARTFSWKRAAQLTGDVLVEASGRLADEGAATPPRETV